jgi:hypothetical protein
MGFYEEDAFLEHVQGCAVVAPFEMDESSAVKVLAVDNSPPLIRGLKIG